MWREPSLSPKIAISPLLETSMEKQFPATRLKFSTSVPDRALKHLALTVSSLTPARIRFCFGTNLTQLTIGLRMSPLAAEDQLNYRKGSSRLRMSQSLTPSPRVPPPVTT